MELPIVEIRRKDGVTVQQVSSYWSLIFTPVFNGIGSWELKLPAEHPAVEDAIRPGAGIVITFGEHIFSGKKKHHVVSELPEDPAGTWVITGQCDNRKLAHKLIYPNPQRLPELQDTAYWVDNGPFETVAKRIVSKNCGAEALPFRQGLQVELDKARGQVVPVNARFDNVLSELANLAVTGGLGFEVKDVDGTLVFDVYETTDRSSYIQMNILNGGLESTQLGFAAPSLTMAIVAGKGAGKDRKIKTVFTAESLNAAADEGEWIEEFFDRRDTEDDTELLKTGEEALSERGGYSYSVDVVPANSASMEVGTDWWLGDVITVVAQDIVMQAVVTAITIGINEQGMAVQATVGNPAGFDGDAQQIMTQRSTEARVSALERNVEIGEVLNPIFASAIGAYQITAANTPVTITLPSNRFTVAPVIIPLRDMRGDIDLDISNRTATSFRISASATGLIQWVALQMSPTSATG